MRKVDHRSLDLLESVVSIARVSKATRGGRKSSFRVCVLVGNRLGCVGYGSATHSEVIEAKSKAVRKAKSSVFRFSLKDGRTIHHELSCKFGASKIFLKPAPPGTGIVAGGAVREFCDMVGVSDVIAKSYGSSNPALVIRNALKAFSCIYPPRYIANKRDKNVSGLE